ncbi:serine hydrolase [Coxiella burnetii]|uniref:serine hydrolase n=1 Tax=Coxiella burnetii TaxID=777 RepID=UPI00217644A4|nr:serine hydrolase [Coxiella burnetii]
MKSINKIILTVSLCYFGQNALAAAVTQEQKIAAAVNNYIQPVIKQCRIPGMAVAVTFNGKNYFFNYGVLSRQSKKPVTQYSLFGIGSLTKLFTATTAVYLDKPKK